MTMSVPDARLDTAAIAELVSIDAQREAAFVALREANLRGLTGHDADAVLAAFGDVDGRCEALHRRVWPRHQGRLVVSLGMAVLFSPTGRSSRLVWRRQ